MKISVTVKAFDRVAFSISRNHILATNGKIHQQMVDILFSDLPH